MDQALYPELSVGGYNGLRKFIGSISFISSLKGIFLAKYLIKKYGILVT